MTISTLSLTTARHVVSSSVNDKHHLNVRQQRYADLLSEHILNPEFDSSQEPHVYYKAAAKSDLHVFRQNLPLVEVTHKPFTVASIRQSSGHEFRAMQDAKMLNLLSKADEKLKIKSTVRAMVASCFMCDRVEEVLSQAPFLRDPLQHYRNNLAKPLHALVRYDATHLDFGAG